MRISALTLCLLLGVPACWALDDRWVEMPGLHGQYYDSQTVRPFGGGFKFWYKRTSKATPQLHEVDCTRRLMDYRHILPESTEEKVYELLCNPKPITPIKGEPKEMILSTGRRVKLP